MSSTVVKATVQAKAFPATELEETIKPPKLTASARLSSLEVEDSDIEGTIEIKIEKDGKIIQQGKQPMRSLLANYIKLLYGLVLAPGIYPGKSGAATSTTITKPDGTSASIPTEWYGASSGGGTPMACNAPDNDSSYGIVVGNGTKSVAISDYALASQIAHGTGAGQLDYNVSTISFSVDTSVSPAVGKIVLSRTFTNSSGATINITEVGIIARNYWKDNIPTILDTKFLIMRDLLAQTYQVPNGATANVIITIKVVLA